MDNTTQRVFIGELKIGFYRCTVGKCQVIWFYNGKKVFKYGLLGKGPRRNISRPNLHCCWTSLDSEGLERFVREEKIMELYSYPRKRTK